MSQKEKTPETFIHPARNIPELEYVPFSQTFGDDAAPHDDGDPLEILGIEPDEWRVVKMVFTVNPETVIGKLQTLTGDQMDLTDTTISRAILLEQRKQDLTTGKYIYLLYSETPEGFGDWTAYPIEQIHKNWPAGVQFPHGSLPEAIDDPKNRIIAVSMDDIFRERGGEPTFRPEKPDSSFALKKI